MPPPFARCVKQRYVYISSLESRLNNTSSSRSGFLTLVLNSAPLWMLPAPESSGHGTPAGSHNCASCELPSSLKYCIGSDPL